MNKTVFNCDARDQTERDNALALSRQVNGLEALEDLFFSDLGHE